MNKGEFLRKIILASGVDQSKIARALKISYPTLHRWQKMEDLNINNIKLIADFINYNLEEDFPEISQLYNTKKEDPYKEKYFEILEKYNKLLEKQSVLDGRIGAKSGQILQKNG